MSIVTQRLRQPFTAQRTGSHRDPSVRSPQPVRLRRVRDYLLWLLQVLTAVGFVTAAVSKFTGADHIEVVFAAMGAPLMYTVGALEIAGAIGLLVPRLCGLASTAFVALMAGALITHAVVGGFALPAVVMFCLALAVAWARRRNTVALVTSLTRGSTTRRHP